MNKYTLVDTSCCKMAKVFNFIREDGTTYNLSGYGMLGQLEVPYVDVGVIDGVPRGITYVLNTLNSQSETDLLSAIGLDKWMIGTFNSYKNGLPIGTVRVLPVMSYRPGVYRYEFIIDNSYKVGGGDSLYDNKGKLLYRGEMKNGVPHGYGTGYYSNGKVGHTGMFKGGKIVQ